MVWGALALVACSEAGERVAVEDVGDADLRIVVANSGAQAEARVLDARAPYRFELEPLEDVFGRGDRLRVWVLGYRVETLEAAFGGLRGRGVADIIGRLDPQLGPLGPGRFAPPPPDTVLFTEVTEASGADVEYAPESWASVRGELELSLVLPGALACPPVGALIRAFARDDPGRVCIYTRADSCEWTRSDAAPCPNQARVFGAEGAIVEQPDGSLRVGETACRQIEARADGLARGETHAYDCDGTVVAVQAQPLDALGALWAPERGPTIANDETARTGQWVPVAPGVYYAFEASQQIELRRIGVEAGQANYEVISHPEVDAPRESARRATSADGTTVRLTGGDFEMNVGSAPDQCFRRVSGTLPVAWATIESRDGQDGLTLTAPGVPAFADALDWQVIGDPGQDFVFSPRVVEARLPQDSGGLGRLSATGPRFPADLLVHGRNRSFIFPMVTRFAGDEKFVSCPRELVRPADPAGPIVAGPDDQYALVPDGVQLVRSDGTLGPVLSSEGETFAPSWTLTRTTTDRDLERVLVYREGVVHLFDPNGAIHNRLSVPGRIVAALPGPDLLYLPDDDGFTVARVPIRAGQLGDTVRYAVPAFVESQAVPIQILPAAVRRVGNTTVVGFSSVDVVGALDLATGLSTSINIGGGVSVQALFEDDGGTETWAAVTTDAGSVVLVQIPAL